MTATNSSHFDDSIPCLSTSSDIFYCLQNIGLDELANYTADQLSCAIPFLTKLLLNPYFTKQIQIIQILYPLKKANDMIQLMQEKAIEPSEIVLSNGETLSDADFEGGSPRDRLRVVLIEYLKIQEHVRQTSFAPATSQNSNMKLQKSWLFDNPLYVEDVALCLFALLNKPTTIPVINLLDMSEALLHVKYGSAIIVYLVANSPDRCQEVCQSLINFGEKLDEGASLNEISDQRARTLRRLCRMSPHTRFRVRTSALQMGLMPSLTIMITLDQLNAPLDQIKELQSSNDEADHEKLSAASKVLEDSFDSTIAFVTGILLGEDEATRSWFAQYIKSAQQKRIDQNHFTILTEFRSQILGSIQCLFPFFLGVDSSDLIDSHKYNKSESDANFLNRKLIQATATLRYFCAMRGIGMMKLDHEESETILSLITCKPPANQTSVNFATVGVCTLLVCSSMINNQKEERRAAEWLKWLIKESNYSDNAYSSHGRCSISELLLLIAIHFQNNQTNQVAELVCATLGMKLQIKPSVSKCKSLFVQEVFNDQMIAEHAVRVPVTNGLDNSITEFLPIHCIHQLLESRSFSKHQVPIKDWIFKQICESKKPVHHMLPKLIEAYVNSVIISTSAHGHCGTNEPIPADEIEKIFQTRLYSHDMGETVKHDHNGPIQKRKKKSKKEKSPEPMDVCEPFLNGVDGGTKEDSEVFVVDLEVAQVLFLYYLTLYEDVRLKKGGDLSPMERAKLVKYGSEFMMDIPVFYLIQLVRDNQDVFGTIFPYLLKLVAAQYPHLCSIQHWLNTTEHYEPYNSRASQIDTGQHNVQSISQPTATSCRVQKSIEYKLNTMSSQAQLSNLEKQLVDGFKFMNDEPLILARVIHTIINLPRHEIWTFVDIFMDNWDGVLSLGNSAEHQRLIKSITKFWWKLNTIFPRRLWVMTVNSLRRSQKNKSNSVEAKALSYSWNELTSDPLIVLRCDSRVFRCPPFLDIVLHVLNGFLAATRRCLQDQIYEQTSRQTKDNRNLEELRTTLVLAQTSAAIQILLESCIPNELEREALNKRECGIELTAIEQAMMDKFDTSVDCICEHLHQVFIADTNLAKLVHFQTYPSELLATTSNKIPSMHICLDFIPELLSQPDLSKQVFVIELTSHLCEKYAITKSLNVAKLCFNVAFTLLQLLPSDKRAMFYIPVLPALLRICKVFPILHEDARMILSQINQITQAHMASTSSRLSLSSSHPFEGLDKMTWHEVVKLMRSLSLNEALFLCIQKCLLETFPNHQ